MTIQTTDTQETAAADRPDAAGLAKRARGIGAAVEVVV